MLDSRSDVIQALADRAGESLNNRLRELAAGAGWPSDAVNALHVVPKDGDLIIHVDAGMQDIVDSLEYGTQNTPPNPVMRKFKAVLPGIVSEYMVGLTAERMQELISQ